MLPSFLKFVEQQEDQQTGVGSPQHEVGEESLSLNKVIEKRIKEMLNEFKTKRRATDQEVLNSIDNIIKKMIGSDTNKQNQIDQQAQPNQDQIDQSQLNQS